MADHDGQPSPTTMARWPGNTGVPLTNGLFEPVKDAPDAGPVAGAGMPGTAPATAAQTENGPRTGMSVAGGQSMRSLLSVLATGLVLGGLVGGLMAGPAGGHPASALVELVAMPDPALVGVDATAPPADSLAAYVAGEFAQLSGEGFRSAVSDRVGSVDAPRIEVSRIGTSSVVSFSAAGATDEAGLKVVQTAVELYGQRRTDEFRAHIESSIASVDQTLRDLQAPAAADRGRTDLSRQTQIDRLLAQRADLILQSHRVRPLARILAPPAVTRSSPTPPWLLPAVLGALVGGLLALGARTLRRSMTTTILNSADVETVTDRVLHPQVALSSAWAATPLRMLRPYDRQTSRLLVAQISGPRPLNGRVISVVGASPASASRRVAAMIAVGAAAQIPTVLVELGDSIAEHPPVSTGPRTDSGSDASLLADCPPVTKAGGLVIVRLPATRSGTSIHDGWATLLKTISEGRHCVVIDAGTSPELLRQLAVPVEAVLAVGLGVDSKTHTAARASTIPAATGRLFGVVTRLPWYQQWRELRRARSYV